MHRQPWAEHEKLAWVGIRSRICTAKPEALLMSRRNTHCFGIDSMVLENNNGALKHVWLCWPESRMYMNTPRSTNLELSIHDHRYDIVIRGIFGSVINHEFDARKSGVLEYKHYTFDSPLTGGIGPEYKGPAKVGYVRGYKIAGGQFGNQSAYLDYTQPHTVEVPQGKFACWTVDEGPRRRDYTNMYSNGDITLKEGLYKPFKDLEDVHAYFDRFQTQSDIL